MNTATTAKDSAPAGQAERPAASTGGAGGDAAGRAERIAEAVTGLPGVAGVTAGPRGRLVTYRVGRPVSGVAVRGEEIEVGVVADGERPLPDVAKTVRSAVRPLADGRPVHVLIADIVDPAADEDDA